MDKNNIDLSGAINLENSNTTQLEGFEKIIKDLQQEIIRLKRDQEWMEKCKDGFRILMEYTPDLLLISDPDGHIIDANHIAGEALGYTREELLTRSIEDIEEHIADHQERLKQSRRGVPLTFEGTHRRKNGTRFPVEVRIWLFESGDQELTLALARDISERKIQEEEKKRLEDQQNFLNKMQSIGTLAGGIAHNFNNILMGIQGNISLMMFDKRPEDRDYVRLNNIQTLIDNGARLTNQLIGYAREGAYYLKTGDLNHIVRETLDFYFKHVTDITVRTELAGDLLSSRIDKSQIEHVLLDLYSNAIDAMPEGGEIIIGTANVSHTDIRGKEYRPLPGKYIRLSVRDTGVGMNGEVMSRLFEPFFTTKGLAKGSGLGLASVYGIVKGHQGYIEVESEQGRGSVFRIYLPVSSEKESEEEKAPQKPLQGKETILLVDDDQMLLDTSRELLGRLGYTVIPAFGGNEAIRLFREHNGEIDVVLLDMVMPEIGGGEVFDRIREINPHIRVLLTSGYSQEGEAEDILKRGCDGFIQKPFRTMEISKRLREILEKE